MGASVDVQVQQSLHILLSFCRSFSGWKLFWKLTISLLQIDYDAYTELVGQKYQKNAKLALRKVYDKVRAAYSNAVSELAFQFGDVSKSAQTHQSSNPLRHIFTQMEYLWTNIGHVQQGSKKGDADAMDVDEATDKGTAGGKKKPAAGKVTKSKLSSHTLLFSILTHFFQLLQTVMLISIFHRGHRYDSRQIRCTKEGTCQEDFPSQGWRQEGYRWGRRCCHDESRKSGGWWWARG